MSKIRRRLLGVGAFLLPAGIASLAVADPTGHAYVPVWLGIAMCWVGGICLVVGLLYPIGVEGWKWFRYRRISKDVDHLSAAGHPDELPPSMRNRLRTEGSVNVSQPWHSESDGRRVWLRNTGPDDHCRVIDVQPTGQGAKVTYKFTLPVDVPRGGRLAFKVTGVTAPGIVLTWRRPTGETETVTYYR